MLVETSKSSSGQIVKTAPDPFHKTTADIVLRSSDNVDFHVRKAILIEVSPIFEDMFSLPQPRADSSVIRPIFMEENSRVLYILLRLCYPLLHRAPADIQLEDICSVLEAATKYDMDIAKELMSCSLRKFTEAQPLRVYAIACLLKLESEAQYAATEAVKQEVISSRYVQELEELPAGCYHRLLQFRAQSEPADNFTFISAATCADHNHRPAINSLKPTQRQWRDAGPPFDRPDADVIVISRDDVRFRLHSTILRIVSSVFSDMLDGGSNNNNNPCQVVEDDERPHDISYCFIFLETSAVLEMLFGLCYFQDPRSLMPHNDDVIHTIVDVIRAATKYSIQHVIKFLKAALADGSITSSPFRTYILATLSGWNAEARAAATEMLMWDYTDLQAMYEPELEQISSGPYFRLLKYHRACGNAASLAVSGYGYSTKKETDEWRTFICKHCPRSSFGILPKALSSLQNFIYTASTLVKLKPHASVLLEGDARRKYLEMYAVGCDNCRETRMELVDKLTSAIKAAIDRVIRDELVSPLSIWLCISVLIYGLGL